MQTSNSLTLTMGEVLAVSDALRDASRTLGASDHDADEAISRLLDHVVNFLYGVRKGDTVTITRVAYDAGKDSLFSGLLDGLFGE